MKKKAAKLILLLLLVGLLGSAFWQGPAPGRSKTVPVQVARINYVPAGIFDWVKDLWDWFTEGLEGVGEWVESIGDWLSGIGDWFEKIGDWFTDFFDGFGDWYKDTVEWITGRFKKVFTVGGDPSIIVTGGYSLWDKGIPGKIAAIYQVFSPLGMVIMIICWAIRCGKAGIDRTLDFGVRNSVVVVVVQLLIGLLVMEIGPQIVMAMAGISYSLTGQLVSVMGNPVGDINFADVVATAFEGVSGFFGIFAAIRSLQAVDGLIGKLIFFYLIQFTFILNIAYMAVLTGICPLFIGFAGGGDSTKRITLNYLKEYGKCALVPPLVYAYAAIAFSLMDDIGLMFSGLVIGISCVGFAKNKLDRLLA